MWCGDELPFYSWDFMRTKKDQKYKYPLLLHINIAHISLNSIDFLFCLSFLSDDISRHNKNKNNRNLTKYK